jgi:L-fuculose-phosphate aldolase
VTAEGKAQGGEGGERVFKKVDGMQNMFQLKQEMCEIGHRIWQKGYCAGNEGNHSVRIAENRILCTPTGFSKGFLKPDMITLVDMEGNQVDKESKYKRTSEILLHLQIYKKRPDVRAVIHSHPPHATAFACAGVPIPEGVHPEAEVFLGKVLTAKYTTPSYKELGESVTKLITPETNTVLLGNHGTVSFSTSLMETYYKLEIVDAYCRILLLIKQIGKVNVLSQQEMVDLLKVKEKFGIPDARLKCAPGGCVGTDNEAFLSTFPDAEEAGACGCGGAKEGDAAKGDAEFEAMVRRVTDQIMAAGK